jgi:hypothetical protein
MYAPLGIKTERKSAEKGARVEFPGLGTHTLFPGGIAIPDDIEETTPLLDGAETYILTRKREKRVEQIVSQLIKFGVTPVDLFKEGGHGPSRTLPIVREDGGGAPAASVADRRVEFVVEPPFRFSSGNLVAGPGDVVETLSHPWPISTPAQRRLVLKIVFEFLAARHPLLARSPHLEHVRRDILAGGHPTCAVGLDATAGDSGLLRGVNLPAFAHQVEVWISPGGVLGGRVVLFGHWVFGCVLCSGASPGTPRNVIAHVVDPIPT